MCETPTVEIEIEVAEPTTEDEPLTLDSLAHFADACSTCAGTTIDRASFRLLATELRRLYEEELAVRRQVAAITATIGKIKENLRWEPSEVPAAKL